MFFLTNTVKPMILAERADIFGPKCGLAPTNEAVSALGRDLDEVWYYLRPRRPSTSRPVAPRQ
jgi:hypothetical protein